MQETWVLPLGWEDSLEEGMTTHSSVLAWKTPDTEEPGRLQSMGLQRVRHDWATSLFFFLAQLLHWCAIFLRTVESWPFALEAVSSLHRFLSFTHLSLPFDFLLTPCFTGRLAILEHITTCTSPQAFIICCLSAWNESIHHLPPQVATCPAPHFFWRSLFKAHLISETVLDRFHFVTSYLILSQWAYLCT